MNSDSRATLQKKFHRYTITSEGASAGYFRLVEDVEGAWVTWAEVAALLLREGRQREAETKREVNEH